MQEEQDSRDGLLPPVSQRDKQFPSLASPVTEPTQPSQTLAAPPAAAAEFSQPVIRRTDDVAAMRESVYRAAEAAAREMEPVSDNNFTLRLTNVGYAGDDKEYGRKAEKEAILKKKSLSRRLRGTWELVDNKTGGVVDSRETSVANVPAILHDGSFIRNGIRYVMGYQQRLRPGVYVRKRTSGELTAQANIKQGHGASHSYVLEPESGLFHVNIGHAKIPLVPLLETLGVSRDEMRDTWGDDLADRNFKKIDAKSIGKLYDRFVPKRLRENGELRDPDRMKEKIRQAFSDMVVDSEVVGRTLGVEKDRLDAETILKATGEILSLSRGEREDDDRDHPVYASYHSAPDIFAERLRNDYGRVRKSLLYKLGKKGNLKSVPSSLLDKQIDAAVFNSGLAQTVEDVNPTEIKSLLTRITRFGEGGLPSTTATPSESRNISMGQFGFIDVQTTPESLKVGVDGYLAQYTYVGDDNKLYTKLHDKEGNEVIKHAGDVLDSTLSLGASPIEGYDGAIVRGKFRMIPSGQADYYLPGAEALFGHAAKLAPFKAEQLGNRTSMAARMATQALSVENPEAPLVQSGIPGTEYDSYEREMGEDLGAVFAKEPGRVISVQPDEIKIKHRGGKVTTIELDNNRPSMRKSVFHQTPKVQIGQEVQPGQLLATSNFTDEEGVAALGKNLRTALVAGEGAWEDAIRISRAAADKMRVHTAQQHYLENDDSTKISRNDYVTQFGNKYDGKQLSNVDKDGVIKPGTVVKKGDPLILAVRNRVGVKSKIHSSGKTNFADASITWKHAHDGVVTDVARTNKGVNVVVRSTRPLEEGDKLCYDDQTDLLTSRGWVRAVDVDSSMEFACLIDGKVEYHRPTRVHVSHHKGRMFYCSSSVVNMKVTPNHELYCRRIGGLKGYEHVRADKVFGTAFAVPLGGFYEEETSQDVAHLNNGKLSDSGTLYSARLLAYLAVAKLCRLLRWTKDGWRLNIRVGKSFAEFDQLIHTYGGAFWRDASKNCSYDYVIKDEELIWFIDRYIADDNYAELLHDFRRPRLLLAAYQKISGYRDCELPYYRPQVELDYFSALLAMNGIPQRGSTKKYPSDDLHWHPSVVSEYSAWVDPEEPQWVDYDGPVGCVTVPGNVLLTRRHGMVCWCGNSGRQGNKGVVTIVPVEQMPVDKDGNPFEMVISPQAVPSRGNSSFPTELLLSRVAKKRGKPYRVVDMTGRDIRQFAIDEAKKHGEPVGEEIFDPVTGRKIQNAGAGYLFSMALHHLSENKLSSRGLGSYSSDDEPARGPGDNAQSKRASAQQLWSEMSHGAFELSKEHSLLRGQKNDEYWSAFMSGHQVASPKISRQYQGYMDRLRASGINPVRTGTQTQLFAMTDSDTEKLSGGREVKRAETVDIRGDLKPISGGLHDPKIFGEGNKWGQLTLSEKIPNPIFEQPIRRLFNLTEKQYRNILAGREPMGEWGTGPEALEKRLRNMDVDKEIGLARRDIAGTRKGKRDQAVRRLMYLKAMQSKQFNPADLMIGKIPVLPPKYRPIAELQGKGGLLSDDANDLYLEIMRANENLDSLRGEIDDVGDERLALYDSYRALTGLGSPTSKELRDRKVKGLLTKVLGTSPKTGLAQRKLLSGNVDTVGRAVLLSSTELGMDEAGLPERIAFDIYQPYIIRELVQRGYTRAAAMEAHKNKTDVARGILVERMKKQPVVITRAPILHKGGEQGFWPKLVKGDALKLPPTSFGPMGADSDGDTLNIYAVHSPKAVKDVVERMLPSKTLLSPADFESPVFKPSQDHLLGLYQAARAKSSRKQPRIFNTVQDLKHALARGEIDVNDPVKIMNK